MTIDESGSLGLTSDHNCIFLEFGSGSKPARTKGKSMRKKSGTWLCNDSKRMATYKLSLEEEIDNLKDQGEETSYQTLAKAVLNVGKNTCYIERNQASNKSFRPKWFTQEVKEAIKERKEATRAHRKASKSQESPEKIRLLWTEYIAKKKRAKSLVAASIKTIDRKLQADLLRGGPEAARKYWQYLRRHKTEGGNQGLVDEEGKLLSDPIDISNLLGAFFSDKNRILVEGSPDLGERLPQVVEVQGEQENEQETTLPPPLTQGLLDGFSLQEVQTVLRKLKAGKAAGPDGIPNELWKNLGPKATTLLTDALNEIWTQNKVPNVWKMANIRLIHKGKGKDITSLEAYRPIALLCAGYKIYTTLWRNRLSAVVEAEGTLGNMQNGFRPGRGVEDSIFTMTQTIECASKLQLPLYVALLDLKGAYDNVTREILWNRMLDGKIPQPIVNHLETLYTETTNTYLWNDIKSRQIPNTKGVRQGCPLSPLLFSIFLGPLEKYISQQGTGFSIKKKGGVPIVEINGSIFADDVGLVSDTRPGLQYKLDQAGTFGSESGLDFCDKKSIVMEFIPKQLEEEVQRLDECTHTFKIQGKPICSVQSAKYLGVWLTSAGPNYLAKHEETLIQKAKRLAGVIRQTSRSSFNRPEVVRTLWKMVAVPSLTHSLPGVAISTHCIAQLESIQFQVGKFALGGTFLSPKTGVEGEMGWSCFEARDARHKNNMEGKLLMLPETAANKGLYRWNVHNPERSGWMKKAQSLRAKYKISANLTREKTRPQWKERVKREVRTANEERWKHQMSTKRSLARYNTSANLTWSHLYDNSIGSDLLFQARTGCLPTRVRHAEIYGTEETCKLCNDPKEDTSHILLHCPALESHRTHLREEIEADGENTLLRLLGFRPRKPNHINHATEERERIKFTEFTKALLSDWWWLVKGEYPYWRKG